MQNGILQTGESPDALRDQGDYPDFFETLLAGKGLTFRRWAVLRNEFPGDVHDCDGWLITGSRHGAYEPHPWIPPLEDFIRRAYAEQVPVVGICFGHQIMAQALGGKAEKFSGGWAIGHTEYDFGDATVALNAWHQDQVTKLPPDARTIASTEFCEHAALAYKGRAYSVQPHPEFNQLEMETLLDLRAPGVVPDNIIDSARSDIAKANNNKAMADRIAAFLKGETHV